MKRLVALSLALVMIVSLAACSSSSSTETEETEEETTTEETEEEEEEAEAEEETEAEEESDTLVIGFANIAEEVELQITVRESIAAAAEEYGVEVVYANNEYDGAKAVENASSMVTQGVDGFIEFNIDETVGPTIMEMMDEAGIPVIAVDIAIEGAVFFGANNELARTVGGEYLGEQAYERWDGEEPDCLLLVEDSSSGESVLLRTQMMYDGLLESYPDFSEDKVYTIDSGTDAATCQEMVSNFLSAHPDYTRIAIGTANDVISTATLAAIETAGRESDCIMVSSNEYAYLDYIKENTEASDDEVWVGCVAFFFTRYGEYTIPAIIDMINGEEVEDAIYVDHMAINRDNAEEYFADYLAS